MKHLAIAPADEFDIDDLPNIDDVPAVHEARLKLREIRSHMSTLSEERNDLRRNITAQNLDFDRLDRDAARYIETGVLLEHKALEDRLESVDRQLETLKPRVFPAIADRQRRQAGGARSDGCAC